MDRSYALLLLFVRLKQVGTTEGVLRIFSGALSELWPALSIEIEESQAEKPSGDRFPLATSTRRYGELVVDSQKGSEPIAQEDRALIFNAVELLQLFLENREKEAEMEDLKLSVEQGIRRRTLSNLELAEQVVSVHGNNDHEGDPHRSLSDRLRWLGVLEQVLLETNQHGDRLSAGELEAVLETLVAKSLNPQPQQSSSFATVESVDVQVGVESGRYVALLLRELLEGVRRSLWKKEEAMDIAFNFAEYGSTLAVSLSIGLGATEGSPRSLSELNRRLARLFEQKGSLEVEESWEWGAARFTVRAKSL